MMFEVSPFDTFAMVSNLMAERSSKYKVSSERGDARSGRKEMQYYKNLYRGASGLSICYFRFMAVAVVQPECSSCRRYL